MIKELPLLYYAKREIIARMDELKRENGTLPPERELSQILSISRPTLRQALEVLVSEGHLIKVPRQGYFCTIAPRHNQIGILQTGKMIPRLEIFSGIIQSLENELCWVSVIQVQQISMVKSICREYGLSGLIYYYPPEEHLEELVQILSEHNMPAVFVSPFSMQLANTSLGSISAVTVDPETSGTYQSEFCLQHSYKRILYLGDPKTPTCQSFSQSLNNGTDISLSFLDNKKHKANFEKLFAEHLEIDQPELLITGGNILTLEIIFKILSTHPIGKTISLLLPNIPEVSNLRKRYPQIKIGGLFQHPFHELGQWAAEELLRQIDGTPAAGLKQIPPHITAL